MSVDPAPQSDLLIDWDTVFAIRYAEVDAGIRAAGHTPRDFNHDVPDDDEPFHIEGLFDTWKMAAGGAGHLIVLRMPFRDMIYSSPLSGYFKFRSGWFDIEVPLASIMREGPTKDDGKYVDFMVDAGSGIGTRDVYLDPPPEGDVDPSKEIQMVFVEWCKAHLDKFKHVFATINIHRKITDKDKDFQWLQPTATRYAVIDDGKNAASGIFGVLCMTENRDVPPNQEIRFEVIPKNVPSAFLISKERFLRKFILECMGYMFSGPAEGNANKKWPDEYFALSQSDTIITNTEAVCIERLLVGKDDPKPYKATVAAEALNITLNNSTFTIELNRLVHGYDHVLFDYLLSVEHFISCDYVLHLDPETQVIDLSPVARKIDATSDEIANHDVEIYSTEAERIAELVLIVVTLVACFAPVASEAAGWVEVVEEEAAEEASSALLETEMQVVGDAEQLQMDYLATTEARLAGEAILNGELSAANLTSIYNAIGRAMILAGAVPHLFEFTLHKLAEGKKTELPSYATFAARVLKPISWPAQDTEYELYGVAINDSFQTYGSWNIKDTNPV
ncbi:MAG: TULIP family P47-like protein [Pseudomonadota bacterium]